MNEKDFFESEVFNQFYKMIEDMIDKKIESQKNTGEVSDYGVIISVSNNEDNTKTKSAIVRILKSGIETDNIKNNTNEVLNVGDKVRVNAVNGNWNNAYINLKCGITE